MIMASAAVGGAIAILLNRLLHTETVPRVLM